MITGSPPNHFIKSYWTLDIVACLTPVPVPCKHFLCNTADNCLLSTFTSLSHWAVTALRNTIPLWLKWWQGEKVQSSHPIGVLQSDSLTKPTDAWGWCKPTKLTTQQQDTDDNFKLLCWCKQIHLVGASWITNSLLLPFTLLVQIKSPSWAKKNHPLYLVFAKSTSWIGVSKITLLMQ